MHVALRQHLTFLPQCFLDVSALNFKTSKKSFPAYYNDVCNKWKDTSSIIFFSFLIPIFLAVTFFNACLAASRSCIITLSILSKNCWPDILLVNSDIAGSWSSRPLLRTFGEACSTIISPFWYLKLQSNIKNVLEIKAL